MFDKTIVRRYNMSEIAAMACLYAGHLLDKHVLVVDGEVVKEGKHPAQLASHPKYEEGLVFQLARLEDVITISDGDLDIHG